MSARLLSVLALSAILLIASSSPLAEASPPDRNLRMTFFDLGDDESTLIQLPDGKAVLIDVGSSDRMVRQLHAKNIHRLYAVIFTVDDATHCGGALDVVREFHPRLVITPKKFLEHEGRRELADLIKERSRDEGLEYVQPGDEMKPFLVADLKIRLTQESESIRADRKDAISLRVSYDRISLAIVNNIIFDSEYENSSMPYVSSKRLDPTGCIIRLSSSQVVGEVGWLLIINPDVAIQSCNPKDQRAFSKRTPVHKTSRAGTIVIETNGRSWKFVGGDTTT